jgi:hypothetical protein
VTTAPTPALLPCPFCGGPASAHEVNPKEAPGWVHLTVAHTPDCFYRAPKETLLLSAADLERWNWRAELEARKPLPLSDDDRLRLRSDVARAIWDVMREHEDRCGHALEDVEPKHQVWDCADAAIRAVHGITGGSS